MRCLNNRNAEMQTDIASFKLKYECSAIVCVTQQSRVDDHVHLALKICDITRGVRITIYLTYLKESMNKKISDISWAIYLTA